MPFCYFIVIADVIHSDLYHFLSNITLISLLSFMLILSTCIKETILPMKDTHFQCLDFRIIFPEKQIYMVFVCVCALHIKSDKQTFV